MDAIILAGGMGKRLRPLTNNMPKCMVPINGKPMLQYHIDWLKRYGIKTIIVACGYKWHTIKNRYGNSLVYSVEKKPLGTGGGIKQALRHVESDDFIVVNADDINNVNIDRLKKVGSNAVCLSRFHSQFGIVDVKKGLVARFRQKPLLPYWANLGVYILNKNVPLPDSGAIEETTFQKIKLKAYMHTGFWVTVNTAKDLEDAGKILKEMKL